MNKYSLLFMAIAIQLSCGSTRITSSWRMPNKEIHLNDLHKVLVVALFKSETNRHKAEDEMVDYLKGKGVVSYNYLDSEFNRQNEEEIRNRIRNDGFDGAITMRLMDVEKDKFYTPSQPSSYPIYYRSFSGYYYRNLPFYSQQGYYTHTKTYTVETNVYSIKEDNIIWSAITTTTDPSGVDKMMDEITKVIYKRMKSEGFIKEK
jgi:hypothetical protein